MAKKTNKTSSNTVKVKMLTNYRDIAKTGDIVEFDKEKADELIRLKRAESLN